MMFDIAALIAAAQAVDPRTDASDIERVDGLGSKRRHAVNVAVLHSVDDQRCRRIAGRDQSRVRNAEIALERRCIAGVGVGERS